MLDIGTIGNMACEVALNRELISLNDKKCERYCLSKIWKTRKRLRELKLHMSNDGKVYIKFINILRSWTFSKEKLSKPSFVPELVFSYLRCCLNAYFSVAVREIDEKELKL